jgi:hypothetical protein
VLDVLKSPELQAAILGMRAARKNIAADINKRTRSEVKPLWQAELARHADDTMDYRTMVPNARVAVSTRQVSLVAGTSGRAFSGGFTPKFNWPAREYGMHNHRVQVQTRSRKGKTYTRTTTIGTQHPRRRKKGRIAGPAAGDVGHRIVSIWVANIVDGFRTSWSEVES